MSVHCPACKRELSTEDSIPKFCSHCGNSLGEMDVEPGERKVDGELTEQRLDVTKEFSRRELGRSAATARTQGPGSTDHGPGPDPLHIAIGASVGPFEIVGVLGEGGMGTVYRATHSESGQVVALKLLSRSVRTNEETVQRFQRESQIAASINHPRSTFVYQAGQHEGQFYITMELMNGGTLTEIVKKEKSIPVGRAVDYILDIISGLQAAHQAGIVHRDLKPSNCFLDHQGRVKVGDFGLAKSFLADSSLTQTGAFMGTPQFAAPEQLRTSEVDERADIYAIGGTLFYLLTGRAPFVGNAAQVIASIASEIPPKVNTLASHVPNTLTQIIHQTLEKEPGRRPENLETLRQMLLPFSTRGATSADLGRRLAAFFVDVAVIGVFIGFSIQVASVFAQASPFKDTGTLFLVDAFVSFLISTFYFSVLESRWGTTLGKWLFGMRVIASNNQASRFVPSVIRAVLVPGLMYLTNSIPAYFLGMLSPETFEEVDRGIWVIIEVQLAQILSWIPVLLCFLTAKKENGYRGFHEQISGSRVVRLAGSLESLRPQNAPVTVPVDLKTPEPFGEFQAIGKIGHLPLSNTTVLLGRDVALDRDVWILRQGSADGDSDVPRLDSEARKFVSRPTRLRVLADSDENEQKWTVVEAVKGMPLMDYVQQTSGIDWRSFRPLLRDLAYELAQAEADDTLPPQLSCYGVWIDKQGRARLLDEAIVPIDQQTPASAGDAVNTELLTSFELITGLLDEFIENQVVPAHVLTFRTELETLRGDPNLLNQIGNRLGELADVPSAWRWDDRLGVLAITIGIEFSTASSAFLIFVLVCAFFLKLELIPILTCSFAAGSLVAILLGALLGGGLAFRLSGVLVRKNKTLEPASMARCAFRNWIAWLPMIIGSTLIAMIVQQAVFASQTESELNQTISPLLIAGLIALLPVVLVTFLGCVYAIVRPSRGLPDVMAGTRLIRK